MAKVKLIKEQKTRIEHYIGMQFIFSYLQICKLFKTKAIKN